MKTTNWYAQRYIDKYKMKLIPLKPSSKLPKHNEWGDLDTPAEYWNQFPDDNIGLNLGESGFCSLDIDCAESFALILEEFGIPASELEAFPTIQGASKGSRIMFRVPEGDPLPYLKLNWPKQDEPKKHYTVFEFRASEEGGRSRFDVLPPSIHPDTKEPYKWIVQPCDPWPTPPAWLIAIAQAWGAFKPQLQGVCPWVEKPTYKPKPKPKNTSEQGDAQKVVEAFCNANPLELMLDTYGYKRIGKRYLSPHSGTGLPGVIPFDDGLSCWIHHASDPLCSEETGQPVNSFDLYAYYEHNNDKRLAIKQAASDLGLAYEKRAKPKELATNPVASTKTAGSEFPSFKALGYNGTSYYYLPKGTEQVSEIKRGSHTSPSELLSLASIEWWEIAYPKKGGIDWQGAANDLMRACERAGIYSQERERGRGAWYDRCRSVLHLGSHLLVDSVKTSIHDIDTSYIYTRQAPLEMGSDSVPANNAQSQQVAELIKGLNWSNPVHARLLAGWCALAPICGALTWRPHLWLTAQRGAGKTWVQDHVIAPLLGTSALQVQGSTTEAGIRQKLKQDARPIIFDEAESEDQNSQKRMKTVLELARQSSSDSTAEIVKGTANGGGMAFRMRSMFLLGSINVSLSHAADESRFSVVTLNAPDKSRNEIDRFEKFSRLVDNTLTDDFCATIRSRSYRLMTVIRKNAKTLSRAVAELLDSQRLGDQVGTLLAGEYSLYSDDELTIEKARELVHDIDFSDAKEAEQVSDEHKLLNTILEQQIRFDSEKGNIQRSIAELVLVASGRETYHFLAAKDAVSVIQRFGLSVENDQLIIANNHNELEKLLKNSPWASGWRRILIRIEESKPTKLPYRFAGVQSRAISIPVHSFIN